NSFRSTKKREKPEIREGKRMDSKQNPTKLFVRWAHIRLRRTLFRVQSPLQRKPSTKVGGFFFAKKPGLLELLS
ncbi:MAG: hypothetical protein WBM43_09060, partial [Flavobacteriaceae bacterium]